MGAPIVIFLKEMLGFGLSSTFTGAVYVLSLLLLIPQKKTLLLFKPNLPCLRLSLIFFGISLLYILMGHYEVNEGEIWKDSIYFGVLVVFFILLLFTSPEIKDYFLPVVVLFTLIGTLMLFYSMITNPFFVVGQRASVVFKSVDGEMTAGNPNMYARNGLFCAIVSYIVLKKGVKIAWWRILNIVNIVLGLLAVLLGQTRGVYLTLFFYISIELLFFSSFNKVILGIINAPRKKKFWNKIFILLFSLFVLYLLKPKLFEILYNYYDNGSQSLEKVIKTIFGATAKENTDMSANIRIENLAFMGEIWEKSPWSYVFGKGYKFYFVDITVMEVLLDYGILGLLSFVTLLFLLFKSSITAIYRNVDPFYIFLGYFYLSILVSTLTTGRPNDYLYFWAPVSLFIRFQVVDKVKK